MAQHRKVKKMKITKRQIRKIIREQLTTDMDAGISKEFAQDVIDYVRQEIMPEQAPALANMSIGDFLRMAADLAGDEPMGISR